MLTNESYSITRSAQQCSFCGREFPQRQPFFSALRDEHGELIREDFCCECWERFRGEPFFSHWTVRRGADSPARPVHTDALLQAFERMVHPQTQQEKNIRFVLALYLTRRKKLKLVGMRTQAGTSHIVFRYAGRKDSALVEDTHLNEQEIAANTERLKQLLDMPV